MTGRDPPDARGATRRDVLGLFGVGAATALSATPLLAGVLSPPDAPEDPVPLDTIRVGRHWRGRQVTLRVEGSSELGEGFGPPGRQTEWIRVGVAGDDVGDRQLLVRRGTCIEVERRVGTHVAIEGVLTEDAFWFKRARVQIPTGGAGPPARRADPPGGPTSVRTHDRQPPDSPPGGLLSVFRRVDASDQLRFGTMIRELATRFEGSIPAVAGEGVFGPLPADGLPIDEDVACTRAAQD